MPGGFLQQVLQLQLVGSDEVRDDVVGMLAQKKRPRNHIHLELIRKERIAFVDVDEGQRETRLLAVPCHNGLLNYLARIAPFSIK